MIGASAVAAVLALRDGRRPSAMAWAATLVLVALLSILIITKTPPNRIGSRLGDLYAWMFGEHARTETAAGQPETADEAEDPSTPWWRRNKTGREEDPFARLDAADAF